MSSFDIAIEICPSALSMMTSLAPITCMHVFGWTHLPLTSVAQKGFACLVGNLTCLLPYLSMIVSG